MPLSKKIKSFKTGIKKMIFSELILFGLFGIGIIFLTPDTVFPSLHHEVSMVLLGLGILVFNNYRVGKLYQQSVVDIINIITEHYTVSTSKCQTCEDTKNLKLDQIQIQLEKQTDLDALITQYNKLIVEINNKLNRLPKSTTPPEPLQE